jgi:rhodanese-related sulfurtransferase
MAQSIFFKINFNIKMQKITVYNSLFYCLLSCVACNSHAQTQTATISADAFEKGIKAKDVQILDVRTAEEYQSGHVANALQANWNNATEFGERVKAVDKTKPVYVYCLGGGRSSQAMQWLQQHGYTNVYNLKGGMNAWKQANKAVEGAVQVPQISLADFQAQLPKDKTVLVDIGAKWCPPCRKMQPSLDSLEQAKVAVVKIDGGDQTDLCKALQAETFPTLIVYRNGIEMARHQGLLTFEELKKLMSGK